MATNRNSSDFPDSSGRGYGDPQSWMENVSVSWPSSSMETPTLEEMHEKARLQAQAQEDERWKEFYDQNPMVDVGASHGANDSVSSSPTMEFFKGRSYAEGRALLNKDRVARGLAPLSQGKR